MTAVSNSYNKANEIVQIPGFGATELPEELLVHIFSYLDDQEQLKSARVCRDWFVIQTKYEEALDKSWELRWFKKYPEDFVKENVTWKRKCIAGNKWICENPMADYLNRTDYIMSQWRKGSTISDFDDEVTVKKCVRSIVSVPYMMTVSLVAGLQATPIFLVLLITIGGLFASRATFGIKDSPVDRLNDAKELIVGTALILSCSIFLTYVTFVQIRATRGIRKIARIKLSKYSESASFCNIL